MGKRNTLRQVRQIIYRMKRSYGFQVDIYQPNSPVINNRRTGRSTITYVITRLTRVVVLTALEMRTFTYDLSYIASNKNFTYGGLFDRTVRGFIFDQADLPKDFKFDLNDHLVYNGRRYEIKEKNSVAEGYAHFLLGNDVAEAPDQVQHLVKVFQNLGVSQNASGT